MTEPTDAQGTSLGRTGAVVTLKVKVTNTGTKPSDYLWVAVEQAGKPKNPPASMASDPPNDTVDWFWRRNGDSANEVIVPTTFTLKPGAHDIVRVDVFLDGSATVGYSVTIYGGPKPNYDKAEADAEEVFASTPLAAFPKRATTIKDCGSPPAPATDAPTPEATAYPYLRLSRLRAQADNAVRDLGFFLQGVRQCRMVLKGGMFSGTWETCVKALSGVKGVLQGEVGADQRNLPRADHRISPGVNPGPY